MPPAPRRGSRAAMTDVYNDLAPKARRLARRLAARRRLDPAVAAAEADWAFVQSYPTHDPARGPFGRRLMFLVAARVTDLAKRRATEFRHFGARPAGWDAAVPCPEESPPPALGRLGARLSRDARYVLAAVLDDPQESGAYGFWHRVWTDPAETPDHKPHLLAHLRGDLGWSRGRAQRAMAAVRDAL